MGKLTGDQVRSIPKMYAAGMSSVEISVAFGVSKEAILYRLRSLGVERRNFEVVLPEPEVLDLYASGISTIEIAKMYNTTHTRISRCLKENGVKLRTKKEALQKYVRINTCVVCGTKFRPRAEWTATTNSNRKTCGPECYGKLISSIVSVTSFKHGQSQVYYTPRALEFKKLECDWCSTKDLLEIHHKDKNKANNTKENIMTLCKSCHAKLHYKQDDRGLRGWNPGCYEKDA